MKTLFTLAVVCLSVGATYAQQVFTVKDFLAAQKVQSGAQVMGAGSTSKSSVESLLFDVQPTIVFQKNQKAVSGNTPAVVQSTDATTLSQLATMADRPAKVQVLEIAIDSKKDLQAAIVTQAMLDNLSNVKYIYFKSQVPCTAADIKKLIPATLTGITVLFDVQQPS